MIGNRSLLLCWRGMCRWEVLLSEILELGVWAAVARDMVAQTSKWMVCRRSVQWR